MPRPVSTSGETPPRLASSGNCTKARTAVATNTPVPEIIFRNRALADINRPSDRRPVFTSASSTTSATMAPSRTAVADASVALMISSPYSSHRSSGVPLGGARPSRRSETGVMCTATAVANTTMAPYFFPSTRPTTGASPTPRNPPTTLIVASVANWTCFNSQK